MPQVTFQVSVEDIARIIAAMEDDELETLVLTLEQTGNELIARKEDIETGRVRPLTRDEVFDV